ncbi:hypothetical protein PZA20_21160 [Pectobacterium polaris]|uniref:hypothetical protein n=1 Tax=Pectobacterium polaris TaxID=2042057 RepID=UPI0023B0DB8C|nr:hypothetical protein [Pectobacterium polaris]MDE8744318.1 hypothetical protein [Pectobacterium polaris]
MAFEIRKEDKIIGVSELEFGDPPMGFVHGVLKPTPFYSPDIIKTGCKLFIKGTNEEIVNEFIAIEDFSEELNETFIEVTILISSTDDYKKYFKNHLDAYEKQFGNQQAV